MASYGFTNKYLTKDEKPWFPIMGEIHYSRYPATFWKESLNKMKAGGVEIVSTYVLWIHHEEIEGEYDFTGDRNLNEFVKCVKECGLKLILRIGPWCHAEARNGGFPDWLLKKPFQLRSNDPEYLKTIEKLYSKIFEQVKELIWSENNTENPIIGVQIENEYGHCGGLTGDEGNLHIQNLTKMAKQIGFSVPLFTATGWGGAMTGGLLPVMGGYCDAPWDQRTTEIEPSGNYIFTHERNDHNIGSDYGFGAGITFDITKFPYLTAELGGGLQPTGHRRTVATAEDIGAMSLVKLGSGVGLLGYYMYHGGTNPDGKLTTLQESRETGYLNDLPVKSYDFRAPIREFGQISETLRELKLLSMFTKDYGNDLVVKETIIPKENTLIPSDLETLRYSFRTDKNGGYLFVNNYVRHYKTKNHEDICITSPDGFEIPKFSVESGDYFFLPYNIKYGNTKVKNAKVTPLCKAKSENCSNNNNLFVFYARKGISGEQECEGFFEFDGETQNQVAVGKDKFLVLTRQDALNLWKTNDDTLIISENAFVTDEKGHGLLIGNEIGAFCSFPELAKVPDGFTKKGTVNKNIASDLPAVLFTEYERTNKTELTLECVLVSKIECSTEKTVYKVDVSSLISKLNEANTNFSDCFVHFNYEGYSAELFAFVDGKKYLLTDSFYLGTELPFTVGLKRFKNLQTDFSNLQLEIKPLSVDEKIYLESKPNYENGIACKLVNSSFNFESEFVIC